MSAQRENALVALKKARSLLDKIIKMIEGEEYCVNVMQFNLAALGLLKSAHLSLMENHLNTCFLAAVDADNKKKKAEMVKEILEVTKLAQR